jgi:hypothetical protein
MAGFPFSFIAGALQIKTNRIPKLPEGQNKIKYYQAAQSSPW